MFIKSANYISGHTKLDKCPDTKLPEFAFLGRSNVGKSSLINVLCDRKKIAKVSQTPGKTQLINFFLMNEEWYLTDLPGIGFAKAPKKLRAEWKLMISNYLLKRETLQIVFYLVDSRLKPQKIDLDFITWMGENNLPFAIVLTKADKPKPRELSQNLKALKATLSETWEELPPIFITSSEKKQGRKEILDYIDELLKAVEIERK